MCLCCEKDCFCVGKYVAQLSCSPLATLPKTKIDQCCHNLQDIFKFCIFDQKCFAFYFVKLVLICKIIIVLDICAIIVIALIEVVDILFHFFHLFRRGPLTLRTNKKNAIKNKKNVLAHKKKTK